jgi:putative ABC transport system permease protein
VLIGQFMTENVLVTLAGGLLSIVISQIVLSIINKSDLILYGQLGVNLRVFVYGLIIALIFGLITSIYPAWRMSRLHPVEALRGRQL